MDAIRSSGARRTLAALLVATPLLAARDACVSSGALTIDLRRQDGEETQRFNRLAKGRRGVVELADGRTLRATDIRLGPGELRWKDRRTGEELVCALDELEGVRLSRPGPIARLALVGAALANVGTLRLSVIAVPTLWRAEVDELRGEDRGGSVEGPP